MEENNSLNLDTQNSLDTAAPGKSSGDEVRIFQYEPNKESQAFGLGLLRVDYDIYDTFIQQDEQKHYHASIKAFAEEKVRKLQQQLQRVNERLSYLAGNRGALLEKQLDLEEKKSEKKAELEQLRKEYREDHQEHRAFRAQTPLLSGIPYIIAGLAFIGAEIFITKEVLVHTLGMQPQSGWIFGLAVALLSIGVKPFFDRIFEMPYRKREKKSRLFMNILLWIVTVTVLVMLGMLGAIRNKAETIRLKDENEGVELPVEWIDFVGSNLVVGVFILSAALFALVGAICLGIGFKSITDNHRHRQLKFRKNKLLMKIQEKENDLEGIQGEVGEVKRALAAEAIDVQQQAEVENVKEEIVQWEQIIYGAHVQMKEAEAKARAAFYQSKYMKGQKYEYDGSRKLKRRNRDAPGYSQRPAGVPRKRGKYIHERFREIIQNRN